MEKSEGFENNNLKAIEHLRHEVIQDKTLSYHDSLFKVIIIGDTGKSFLPSESA
jgi:hypothetical protein